MKIKMGMALFPLLIFLFVLFCFLFAGARWFENRNLYFPSKDMDVFPYQFGMEFAQFTSYLKNGSESNGWFVPAVENRGTIIVCHGNAGNISHRMDTIKIFHEMGLNVAIFDYPGYGISQGKPTEKNLYDSAEEVFKTIIDQYDVQPSKTIIFGRSLGAAVAVELASRMDAAGLIMESGFTSTKDMGKELFPFLPMSFMVSQDFDSLSKVGKIKIPKLIIHSPDDELIPFKHGEKIFGAASEPKKFLKIQGNHNEGYLLSLEDYVKGIDSFLARTIPNRKTVLI